MSAGRKKDPIWYHYEELKSATASAGCRAKCIKCGKEMQGLVARMKSHFTRCIEEAAISDRNPMVVDDAEIPSTSCGIITQQAPAVSAACKPVKKSKLDSFIVRTTASEKQTFDIQVARMIFATNSPFRLVENPEFKRMVEMLHPGYSPPSEHDVGGHLLDLVYTEEQDTCAEQLNGETVCMSLDGWSNVHNEPIVCTCVTTSSGDTFLVDTVDTSGHPHTSEYLAEISNAAIKKTQTRYGCFIRSFVTDNAANMTKMRRELEKEDDETVDIITYGCSSHILNLLAKDLTTDPATKEHVVQVIKYFRTTHMPNALYRQAGGSALCLPLDVRWNSLCDCLTSYINNWSILMNLVEDKEKRELIDPEIRAKVTNLVFKRNAEDLLSRLEFIAAALDSAQRNNCTLSQVVVVWKRLKTNLKDLLSKKEMKLFNKRYEQALTPAHFIAYLVDPTVKVKEQYTLTVDEKETAIEFAHEKYGGTSFLPLLMKLEARVAPFKGAMFHEDVLGKVNALEWWKSLTALKECVGNRELEILEQLLSAVASSAGVERIFSSFNLVHSKLRNKLGVEKAGKLVFLFKMLNVAKKKPNKQL